MTLQATILLGTLKPKLGNQYSNTRVLCEVLDNKLMLHDVRTEIVHLAEYHIPPGTKSDMGAGDDWPQITAKLLASDIIIFATPIWWGGHSSLIQRALERLDELNDEIIEKGEAGFLNKVGGIVITGAEDGAQHVIGTLCNFLIWNSITLPPASSLSFLGSPKARTKTGLKKEFLKHESTVAMAETMAQNLAHMARLLKDRPLPSQEKNSQGFN